MFKSVLLFVCLLVGLFRFVKFYYEGLLGVFRIQLVLFVCLLFLFVYVSFVLGLFVLLLSFLFFVVVIIICLFVFVLLFVLGRLGFLFCFFGLFVYTQCYL